MLEFPELFPDARVIKLEENFRSAQPILDVANTIINEATESYAKQLFSQIAEGETPVLVEASDENEQSRFIVQRIEELHEEGVPYQEMAVLFRSGSHSFDLEIELGKHAIPFRKFGGIKFVESAHIKDLLAFLRVVVNPGDTISWYRMLKLVDHIGDATVEQILDFLDVERKEFRTARAREAVLKKLKQFPAKARYADQLIKLANVLQSLLEGKTVRQQLTAIERFYKPILQANYDDHPRRWREIEHLGTIAKRYKSAEELLADAALDPVEMALAESQARGQGFVTLSTVHSAKGLEWSVLFSIWMVDGWFPSSRSYDAFEDLEEERRLLYVAATRAKQYLYFISPMSGYDNASVGAYGSVSRFLDPIPERLLPRATLAGE
jgi:DNA helicase-2/ATP-dependent DNA helicase PcrA